ncbi:hypothetical protein J437_LFUL010206 [Ladona fulva]|uniref:Uncharacterized protein n=1 Tax=Ladona fulva TaxID=123851 RepID=A0A8K0NZR5_LADFU|nr:hypothetical protein J437_LFUL010206 [Ladona fulva]
MASDNYALFSHRFGKRDEDNQKDNTNGDRNQKEKPDRRIPTLSDGDERPLTEIGNRETLPQNRQTFRRRAEGRDFVGGGQQREEEIGGKMKERGSGAGHRSGTSDQLNPVTNISVAYRLLRRMRREEICARHTRFLNEPQRWVGRCGATDLALHHWPPRSPNLTACDFFWWGFVKDALYVLPLPTDVQQLKELHHNCAENGYSGHATQRLG